MNDRSKGGESFRLRWELSVLGKGFCKCFPSQQFIALWQKTVKEEWYDQ